MSPNGSLKSMVVVVSDAVDRIHTGRPITSLATTASEIGALISTHIFKWSILVAKPDNASHERNITDSNACQEGVIEINVFENANPST